MTANEAGRAKILDDEKKWYQQVDDNARAYLAADLSDEQRAAFAEWNSFGDW